MQRSPRQVSSRSLLLLAFVLLFVAVGEMTFSPSQARADDQRTRDRFVGAWRLVWLEEQDASGKVHRADCSGLLVYTRDGHMSVQVMYRNPGSSQAGEYAQGGYEASFGTYNIDAGAHTFNFHVEGAVARSLIGRDLPRAYELSGKQLIVKSTNPNEHWRVAWERY